MASFTQLKGYEDLEVSTQMVIVEARNRKFEVKIIDREKNLIFISKKDKRHFIKEATICEAVSSISAWLSNDKWISKNILLGNNVSCVNGVLLRKDFSPEEIADIRFPAVVKPVDANCGVGISVNIKSRESLVKAIKHALKFSDEVIVEDFFKGKEYRFLVIDYRLRAITHRDPANVVGDGIHSINWLIEKKNSSPPRGSDYTAPLLKIRIDDVVERYLIENKISLRDIPPKSKKVYLRTNSNLSTGGDSVDATDDVPDFYKREAEKAARILRLKIAGIDMMIKNIHRRAGLENNYVIVEVNSSPGLFMHGYPFSGKDRNVAKYVLDVLYC